MWKHIQFLETRKNPKKIKLCWTSWVEFHLEFGLQKGQRLLGGDFCCGWWRPGLLSQLKLSHRKQKNTLLLSMKYPGWWFFTNPSEKYAQVKLEIFPKVRGENKKYLSCHHLVLVVSYRDPYFMAYEIITTWHNWVGNAMPDIYPKQAGSEFSVDSPLHQPLTNTTKIQHAPCTKAFGEPVRGTPRGKQSRFNMVYPPEV